MSSGKKQIEVAPTCLYGRVEENSKYYDVKDEVGKSLLDYRITKIKCQVKSNDSIYGIQFYYRNINTGKETALINVKAKETDLIEQEMTFGVEEIVDLRTWVDDEIQLIGFEITTNRGRIKKFGYGNDEQLRTCPDFLDKDKTIVGFGVTADNRNRVVGLYGYYLNKKTYAFYLYSGVFSLRIKTKDENYKKKFDAKYPNMNEKYKVLYKVCCLPDNQFYNIIKYALS